MSAPAAAPAMAAPTAAAAAAAWPAEQDVAAQRGLRPYQQTAIDLVRESLRTGHRRPIIQLPTGAGKTRIAAEIINMALAKERRAIFVVPRISLIEQTVASFEGEGIWNVGVIQGQHFRTNPNAPVQIASAQTLARREIPPADVVIVDECHLQFKSITEWIAAPEWQAVPFIGLSATPWAKGLGNSYDDLLMPVSIGELIDEGYLSPFRVFAPPAPDLTSVRTVAGDFDEGDLSTACDKTELVGNIVETWLEKGENRPTLCYGVDRKHAQHLQERFTEAGVRVEYIDCDTKLFDREEIFERFRAGETKLICNVATLDTGIDLDVRCIIDARPTKSRIRFVQTIGRGLRPGEGKDHLIVLDHAGNHQRLGIVTDIGCSGLDDGDAGRAYDKDGRVAVAGVKLCPECRCVLPPRARECPSCGLAILAVTPIRESDEQLVELGSGERGDSRMTNEEKRIGTRHSCGSATKKATVEGERSTCTSRSSRKSRHGIGVQRLSLSRQASSNVISSKAALSHTPRRGRWNEQEPKWISAAQAEKAIERAPNKPTLVLDRTRNAQ